MVVPERGPVLARPSVTVFGFPVGAGAGFWTASVEAPPDTPPRVRDTLLADEPLPGTPPRAHDQLVVGGGEESSSSVSADSGDREDSFGGASVGTASDGSIIARNPLFVEL